MRPISYRPVLRYQVPESARRDLERESARTSPAQVQRRMAPVVALLSEEMAAIDKRLDQLSQETGLGRETVAAFLTAQPSSKEGREAKSALMDRAGGFMGDHAVRRSVVLEAGRISLDQSLDSGLRAWGAESGSVDQAAFEQLSADEEALRAVDGDEARGRLRRIDAWSRRLERRASWVRELIKKEEALTVPGILKAALSSRIVRNRVQIIIGQRMRAVDRAYWDAISRAKNALGSFPRLIGHRAIQERATYEWADDLVRAAEEWARTDPRAEPYAAELVAELARMRLLYETSWSVAMEAEMGLEQACDQALELMDPFLRLQAIFRSFAD